MGNSSSTRNLRNGSQPDTVILEDDVGAAASHAHHAAFATELRTNMQRLIIYAQSTDASLQREVAERLANEAVHADRRRLIIELDGLSLLLPLMRSTDSEIQRLAAHSLANLSVEDANQVEIVRRGALEPLVALTRSPVQAVARQAAKALANLAVHAGNKRAIAAAGAFAQLIELTQPGHSVQVMVEAVAALANLSVDDENELAIGRDLGGVRVLVATARDARDDELLCQCARALRNLSVHRDNQALLREHGGLELLQSLRASPIDRVRQQVAVAIANLEKGGR